MSPPSPVARSVQSPALSPVEHHLEAVAGTAQHVADEKLALALLACREHRGQHRLQSCDQFGANLVAFSIPVFRRVGWCR